MSARSFALALALVVVVASAACFPDRTEGKACDAVLGCLDGYVCIDEVCVEEGRVDEGTVDEGSVDEDSVLPDDEDGGALSDAGG